MVDWRLSVVSRMDFTLVAAMKHLTTMAATTNIQNKDMKMIR
jgi:hypothetical protein